MKKLKVRWKAATVDEFLERHGKVITEEHVFLVSDQPLDMGTVVEFEFRLGDETPFLSGTATVAATRDMSTGQPGMLLEFDELSEEHADTISRLRDEVGGGTVDLSPPKSAFGDGEDTRPDADPLKGWKA